MGKITHVIKRTGVLVPFKSERIMNAIYRAAVAVGGRDKERADFLADATVKYLESRCQDGHTPSIEEIQDAVEKVLIEHGHAKVAKAFIIYREDRNKRRHDESKFASKQADKIPWQKIWYTLNWSVKHNLHTVESLNERIRKGEFPHIVHESESAYESDISTAAELILEKKDSLKMVFVTGPSSSGKTTTTIKLEKLLEVYGLKLVAMNLDHYFFDLELHPKDEFGDYDFETPQALDLELINEHLLLLSEGKEVLIPSYDFKSGTRKLNQTPMKLEVNEILLIDSLHGLYPQMSHSVSEDLKFNLYIEPLLQMSGPDGRYVRWTDLRLIRRMLRDSVHRAYNPTQTLEHWHYVRSSELRNIIPYINRANYIINSGMPYELPLYKPIFFEKFLEWERNYRDNPLRVDAFNRASRLLKLLSAVEPVHDDSPVPGDSVLREFIGGSTLDYS